MKYLKKIDMLESFEKDINAYIREKGRKNVSIKSLYELKQHLEDKRLSDGETLKLFKKIEDDIKNLESYEELYSKLANEINDLSENGSSTSEIGEHVKKHFLG